MIKYIKYFLILLFLIGSEAIAKEKIEELLLDGSVPLKTFGIDSTRNWWAITEPFNGQLRVWINGIESQTYIDLKGLVFSPSGDNWAYFGRLNSGWNVVTNTEMIPINAYSSDDVKFNGEIQFSRIGEKLAYSYTESNQEYLHFNNKKVMMNNRSGSFFINQNGNKYAYVSKRGNSYIIDINGRESQLFDAIKPIGYMNNDKFMYAAKNGNLWEVFSEDKVLTEGYKNISEVAINPAANTAAVIAQLSNDYFTTVLFNNDYIEPLYGGQYDILENLVIHPNDALIACTGMLNHAYFVLLNNTEYGSEEFCQAPKFSYEGSELFFMTCRLSCYLVINGKKHKMSGFVSPNINFAKKPNSMNISYAGPNSIMLQEIESGELYASLIIDRIADPIYNWKTNYYETVASIGQRLYLLGIRP